jgi:hypothetical protein
MKLEIVYDKGYIHHEVLFNHNGIGSNEAVDMRGNKYEYNHLLNRWEKKASPK